VAAPNLVSSISDNRGLADLRTRCGDLSEARTSQLPEIVDYTTLVLALRARAEELNISREQIDAIAGLPDRYTGKVLSIRGKKRIGLLSLGPLLGALGIKLMPVEDPEALARVQGRFEPRSVSHLISAKSRWATHNNLELQGDTDHPSSALASSGEKLANSSW
jgi:hypothetical protein